MTVKELLKKDPLAEQELRYIESAVRERLFGFLTAEDSSFIKALNPFVDERPWRYWSINTLSNCLRVLENDPERTFSALDFRADAVDIAFDTLFRPSNVLFDEDTILASSAKSYLRLSTGFLPEYLHWSEHIMGNLLQPYWSLYRSGGIDAKFRLRNATDYLKKWGLVILSVDMMMPFVMQLRMGK